MTYKICTVCLFQFMVLTSLPIDPNFYLFGIGRSYSKQKKIQ